MDTPQILIGLLAALVPGIGYIAPALRWLKDKAIDNGLSRALAKTESEIILADKLDTMGEHDWAAETRDIAQTRPLKILIGFEIHRNNKWWTWLTVLGPTVYVVAATTVLASAVNFPPQVSISLLLVGCALFILSIVMFLGWAVLRLAWFERRLNQMAKERLTRSKLRRLTDGDKGLS